MYLKERGNQDLVIATLFEIHEAPDPRSVHQSGALAFLEAVAPDFAKEANKMLTSSVVSFSPVT